MSKRGRPADAWNEGRHIHPDNSSKGMSRGGKVIGEALRGTREMNTSGGCDRDRKQPKEGK